VTLTTAGSSSTTGTYFTLLAMYRTSTAANAPAFTNIALVARDIYGCGGSANYACINVPQTVVAGVKYYFQVDGQFGSKGNVVLAMSYTA